jgi:hypothetical protein
VLPLAVAVLAGGAGAWSFIDAQQKYTLLSGGGVKTLKEGQQLVSDGTLQQQLGVAGFGVAGGALIAAVVVWFALAPASVPDVVPGVSAGPGGAMAFSLGGHW